ncbi:MAG TPA: hypothetical protein VGL40_09355 [Bacillota bacterium]|jgi:hypothetical protein
MVSLRPPIRRGLPARTTIATAVSLVITFLVIVSAPASGALSSSGPLGSPTATDGGLVFAAGLRTLSVSEAEGPVLVAIDRALSPWPAAVAVQRVAADSWLVAVVDGRPSTLFDHLRFRGPWRSAPPRVGGRLTLYRFDRAAAAVAKVWRGPESTVNPWWAGFGDFTGDGRPSLLVGVWKTARFDPVYDRRPFIYGLYPPEDDDTDPSPPHPSSPDPSPYPLWLGSRLSSPFINLTAGDVDGDGVDEIAATTTQADGGYAVSVYDWSGFGVTLGARVEGFRQVAALSVIAPGRLAVVGRRGPGGDALFIYRAAGEALAEVDSIRLPANWNRPGDSFVTSLGGGEILTVRPDGRVTAAVAPGR